MKKGINQKAWAILTQDEKTVLELQHIHDKSTWDGGEILKKAHYKYLEIKARGEKFLKMFSLHFTGFEHLKPPEVELNPLVEKYFEYTIVKRLRISTACRNINNEEFKNREFRETLIRRDMIRLKRSENALDRHFYNIIMDFDRYNNYRIMPEDIQEPSAFKRRIKNWHKKILATSTNLAPIALQELRPLKYRGAQELMYVALIESVNKQLWEIVPMKRCEGSLRVVTHYKIYAFADEYKARNLADLMIDYFSKGTRHCSEGLRFWPSYRELIKGAINYADVNHIDHRRGAPLALKDYSPALAKKYLAEKKK